MIHQINEHLYSIMNCFQNDFGHVPLKVSKLSHYFIGHGGEISGEVEDNRHRRSPIPSGGLEVT